MRFDGIIDNALKNSVRKLTIETAYGPKIEIDRPFAPGAPSPLMAALRPRLRLDLHGADPVIIEPYGAPGESKWGTVQLVLVGVAALAATGIWFLLKRRK